MLLEVLGVLLLGCITGTITGLTPGLHTNTIALIVVSGSSFLTDYFSPSSLVAFIVSMSITHTFVDAIPSIYLGAPDEAQVLSILPGHKMLLKGEGYNALKLTVIGSFFALILSVLLMPLLIPSVKFIYPLIKEYIGWILLVIIVFMVFKDKRWFWNLLVFIMSGTLGLVVLNTPNLKDVLFPLLSGLFGFSVLIPSLKDKVVIPEQDLRKGLNIKKSLILKSTIGATLSGFLASFLPGFSSSQSAILAQQFLRKIGDAGFLILIGGINTANMVLSLVTLYSLDRARNGSVIAISKIVGVFNPELLWVSIVSILITAGIAVIISLNIAKIFSHLICKVTYAYLIIGIILFISLLVLYFSGFAGLLILITSTSVGLVASLKGIGKNHLMGSLILPIILFFLL